jgi:hypothetical protein
MNSYHERTRHLIQFKIPPKGWAVIGTRDGSILRTADNFCLCRYLNHTEDRALPFPSR